MQSMSNVQHTVQSATIHSSLIGVAAHLGVHPIADAALMPTLAVAVIVAVAAAVVLYTPHGQTV
eukprot:8169703-Ditylum_brightwellii.AAC.1